MPIKKGNYFFKYITNKKNADKVFQLYQRFIEEAIFFFIYNGLAAQSLTLRLATDYTETD